MSDLLDKIVVFELRAAELEQKLGDPGVASSPADYAVVAKDLSRLRPAADAAGRYRRNLTAIEEAQVLLSDPDAEVRELAEAELSELVAEREALEAEIRLLLVPGDPNDEKDVILELRAGTGGDEAALFAMDLLRMYSRYAEKTLSIYETDGGGAREAILNISGDRVYSRLKYERGVHRVQRVPATESQGRIHTSTVTVAVLPEAEEVDVKLDPKDLRIDVFRSSGPGGQSVNTTDSAVRITHEPTGTVVQCQDEKSQHKNKARALKILRSRLLERAIEQQADERSTERRAQVGSGERSEKIRTYNYPQSRVTDHRAGLTLHRLESIVEGELDEILEGVHSYMTARAMAAGEAA